MVIKEWIQFTLHEMADEIICAIKKEIGGGFLTQKSCKEIEKIIYKYSEEIFSAQNETAKEKLKE